MSKLAFIYNPQAGRGGAGGHLAEIIEVLSEKNDVTVLPTKRKNHLRDYIGEQGKNFDTVVVAGGDGTVNEAVNALMGIEKEKRPSLGYIPLGTTNDFASSCNLPHDVKKAARVAVGDKERYIDAGKFNESYFSYVAAFGLFTSVAYDTERLWKNIFGYAAYVVEGIKSLASVKPCKIKVETDSGIMEDEFIFGMVANSSSIGGMKLNRLDIDLSDGLFEVLLIKKIKSVHINMLLGDLLSGKTESEYYYSFKTDRIKFTSNELIAWTLDGEYGGEANEATVENIGKAIKIRIEE